MQPPQRERHRLHRGEVRPAEVVDHDDHRPVLLAVAERLDHRRADRERVTGIDELARVDAEQLAGDAEGQIDLELVARRPQDGDVAGALEERVDQRRLPGARLGVDEDHLGCARSGVVPPPCELVELAATSDHRGVAGPGAASAEIPPVHWSVSSSRTYCSSVRALRAAGEGDLALSGEVVSLPGTRFRTSVAGPGNGADRRACQPGVPVRSARICSRRMSACPACCASSRSTWSSSAHTGRSPRPSTRSSLRRPSRLRRDTSIRSR